MPGRHGKKVIENKSKKIDYLKELRNKGKIPVIKKEIEERFRKGQEGPQIRDEVGRWHTLLRTDAALAELGFTFSMRGVSRKPQKRVSKQMISESKRPVVPEAHPYRVQKPKVVETVDQGKQRAGMIQRKEKMPEKPKIIEQAKKGKDLSIDARPYLRTGEMSRKEFLETQKKHRIDAIVSEAEKRPDLRLPYENPEVLRTKDLGQLNDILGYIKKKPIKIKPKRR